MYDPNNFDELEDFWMKSRKLTEENFVGAWWINFIPISVLSLGGFPWIHFLIFCLKLDNVKFTWFKRKLFQILGILFFLAPDTFQSDGYVSESRHGFHFIKLVFTWYWKTGTVGILEVIWNWFCSIQFLCFYTSLVFWIQWFKWV